MACFHLWKPAQIKQRKLLMIVCWRRMQLSLKTMINENEPILKGNMQSKESKEKPWPSYSPASWEKWSMLGRREGAFLIFLLFLKISSLSSTFFSAHCLYTIWKYRMYLVTGYVSKWKKEYATEFSKDTGSRISSRTCHSRTCTEDGRQVRGDRKWQVKMMLGTIKLDEHNKYLFSSNITQY